MSIDILTHREHLSNNVAEERRLFTEHFERMQAEDPDYFGLVSSVADQFDPMPPECRLVFNIPACREQDRVYNALEMILIDKNGNPKQRDVQTGQPLPAGRFELMIFNNWGVSKGTDRTESEIQRFTERYPEAPVFPLSMELPDERGNVGFARRLLQDVTCLRSLRRPSQDGPLYIATEDADTEGYDPDTVDTYIRYLDEHPDEVGARSHIAMNPLTLRRVPHLFMRHRIHRLANILIKDAPLDYACPAGEGPYCTKFVPAAGYGIVYAAKDMIAAGGFQDAIMSEDYDMWKRMYGLENSRGKGGLQLQFLPPYSVTSPRRYVVSDYRGHNMYGPGNWESTDDLVRLPEEVLMEQIIEKHESDMELQRTITTRQVGSVAMERFRQHLTPTAWRAYLGRALLALGILPDEYSYDGETLVIRNWEGIEERVRNYKPNRRIQRAMNLI